MERRGRPRALVMHDPLAVAVALDPSLVVTRALPVDVETRGELTRGQTARRLPREKGRLGVALEVDAARFRCRLFGGDRAARAALGTEAKSDAAKRSALYALTRIYLYGYIPGMETVFDIIAEPNRRAILGLLADREQSVGDIERKLRLPQPTVSKHLRVLRDAGFVEASD